MITTALQRRGLVLCRQRLRVSKLCTQRMCTNIRSLTTTTTTTTTTTRTARKRPRKRPQIRKSTKDRIRSLDAPIKPVMAHAAEAATFLESRLKEAQTMVRGFWNRDGRKDGPSMDRWWWTWNIMFALTPAAALAIFMELCGKPWVETRSKEIEIYNRTKLDLLDGITDTDDDDDDESSDIKEESTPLTVGESQQAQVITSDATTIGSESQQPQVLTTILGGDPSMVEIHQRIKVLEEKLDKQNRKMEKQKKNQQQRMNQSGIQNRFEDKLRIKELQKNTNKKETTKTETTKEDSPPTMLTIAQAYMAENLRAKRDAVMEYGRQQVMGGETKSQNDSTTSRNNKPQGTNAASTTTTTTLANSTAMNSTIITAPAAAADNTTMNSTIITSPAEHAGASSQDTKANKKDQSSWFSWTTKKKDRDAQEQDK